MKKNLRSMTKILTHLEYASRGIYNYGQWNYSPSPAPFDPNYKGFQTWRKNPGSNYLKTYTSLFINLIDDIDESVVIGYSNSPVDQVTGYTFPQIESSILPYVKNLDELKNRLKMYKPSGITNAQIDGLLSYYY